MALKLIITTVFCLLGLSLFAQQNTQSSFSTGISNFLSWIENVDKTLNSIDDKEILRKAYRLLGDVNLDLDDIQTENYVFAVSINKSEIDRNDLQLQIKRITDDNSKLTLQLANLASLLNQSKINLTVNGLKRNVTMYSMITLDDIDKELNKQIINKKGVLDDANQCKAQIADVNLAISKIRDKIKQELMK